MRSLSLSVLAGSVQKPLPITLYDRLSPPTDSTRSCCSLSTVHLSSPRVANRRFSPSKITVRFVGSALPELPSVAWVTPNTMRIRRPSERRGPAKLRRMPLPSGRAPPSHSSSAFCQFTSRFSTPRMRARRKPFPLRRHPPGAGAACALAGAAGAAPFSAGVRRRTAEITSADECRARPTVVRL